jgi:ectoine hydroxylase
MPATTTTPTGPLSPAQAEQFHRDGWMTVRGLFDREEMDLLLRTAKADNAMTGHAFGLKDRSGLAVKLSLWNHPGDDIYGMFSRSRRVVDACEQLLGGEVYHYHSKMILKEPRVGGAWEWHQDYGYWYKNGCLLPDMISCLISLDPATRENGCIQMMSGSHKMGRIEHGMFAGQTGADPERVAEAAKRMAVVYCEAEPGDALFFHGNTLHCSGPNHSDKPRWALICCYNAAWNDPYKKHHHPSYTKLHKVDDGAIKAIGAKPASNDSFMNPETDATIRADRDKEAAGT